MMAFYDGFLLQTHPQITILHPKPIMTAQLGGFFKVKYSMIGSLSVPSCGYMENVCSFGPHSATSDHLDFVAGSGKSVLWLVLPRLLPPTPSHNEPSSSIIQDIMTLYNAERASMAYFYFDFKDIDKQKLSNLLPSLLIQLSARSNPCCDILSQLYSVHDRGVQKPNDHVSKKCLCSMQTTLPTSSWRQSMSARFRQVFHLRERRCLSLSTNLLTFTSQTSTSVSPVILSSIFRPSSNF